MTPEHNTDLQPVELDREGRRGLYNLLDADLPRRTRRIEFWLIALTVSSSYRLLGGAPIPIEQAPVALIRLIFG